MAEVAKYRKDVTEKKAIDEYLDKFCKIPAEKAKSIRDGLNALNNPKINDELIVKVIDFMPEDVEEVNKIFNEMGLTEEEAKAILDVVKK